MATSTNYGWAEPDNSSLVKNGASDIRTLGNAIDVSLWNSGFGQAGKNKIINGNFAIWQRGTTFNTSGLFFGADRFKTYSYSGSSSTISQQAFTVGAAPVAGYEAQYFCRVSSTNTQNILIQNIEDVRTFAAQTITVSFWAKSASATTVTVGAEQNFGSGGSASVYPTLGTASVTTSWARYSVTYAIPSISGKTVGTSSYLQINLTSTTLNNNLDIWGLQAEAGSTATPFQTASGGSPQAELAMCQRYYYLHASGTTGSICNFLYFNSTTATAILSFPVTMRIAPTLSATSGTSYYAVETGTNLDYMNSMTLAKTTTKATQLYNASEALGTVGLSGIGYTNDASASLAFSAEL